MTKRKVFGIGFHKTGTFSLHHALQRVGLDSVHWLKQYRKHLTESMSNAEVLDVLSPSLEKHDAFVDVPFQALYADLDLMYPGSRFILTTRESAGWWKSVTNHWSLAEGPHRLGALELVQYNHYEPYTNVATLDDGERLTAKFDQHNRAVLSYFQDRPEDLLVIDWKSDDRAFSWESFCSFLGVEMPEDTSEPWYNKTGAKTKTNFSKS